MRQDVRALLLRALRRKGLGVFNLFEGREEPVSWIFRVQAFDQSELDIFESGAVGRLSAPSAHVELVVDEVGLAICNVGLEALAAFLVRPQRAKEDRSRYADGGAVESDGREASVDDWLGLNPESILGFVRVDVTAPSNWLEERESDASRDDLLLSRLQHIAEETGTVADAFGVDVAGAVDMHEGWQAADHLRPADVALYFSFDIPLVGTGKRELDKTFSRVAVATSEAIEGMRSVFQGAAG